MPNPKPIPPRKRVLDIASSSFRSHSPIAQEIVARDVAECSEDDVENAFRDDEDEIGSESESESGPVLYKQPVGVAFGYRRPSLLNDPVNEPVLTRVEKKQSRNAERSLLRDNHILPPKHIPEKQPGMFSKLYKSLFSTKVRRAPDDEEVPRIAVQPSESSPLLASTTDPSSPHHEHLDEQWDAAVASGKIETTWQREAKTIAIHSRSLILTFLLQYSINITSIFAVGRIGKVELGAVSCKSRSPHMLLVLYTYLGT